MIFRYDFLQADMALFIGLQSQFAQLSFWVKKGILKILLIVYPAPQVRNLQEKKRYTFFTVESACVFLRECGLAHRVAFSLYSTNQFFGLG